MNVLEITRNYVDKDSNDILIITASLKSAERKFYYLVKDYLSECVSKYGRCIKLKDGSHIYVQPISSLNTWVRGRKFKIIRFES